MAKPPKPPIEPPKLRIVKPSDKSTSGKRRKPTTENLNTEAAPGMNDAIRAEIVMRLACFDTLAEVGLWLVDEHGISMVRQSVAKYNITAAGSTKDKRWIELFNHTREQWLKEMSAEPIAHRAYRLRRLSVIHDKAMQLGDLGEAREALQQAAKEVGNVFSNVTKQIGSTLIVDASDLSPEERRNILSDRLRAAAEKIPAALPKPASQTTIEG